MLFVYNPENFDPTVVLPAALADLATPARLLLGCVLSRLLKGDVDECGFVNLKAAYLQALVGRREMAPVRAALIKEGVVECDGWYVKGEKAFGYRLLPPYCSSPPVRIAVTDRRHVARLRHNKTRVQTALTHPVHRRLFFWLNAVGIDAPAARADVHRRTEPGDWRLQHLLAVEAIAAGDWWLNWDERGRVYHNLVNLPRYCRRHLALAGERVAMVDVANSQPLIFGAVVMDRLGQRDGALQSTRYLNSSISNIYFTNPPSYDSKDAGWTGKDRRLAILPPDLQLYLELCQHGVFYERMMTDLGVGSDRHEFKKHFFAKVLFARSHRSKEAKHFVRTFPTVFQVLSGLRAKDYRRAPLVLQSLEATLVVKTVCRRLMRNHPDLPFLTIHDAVITTAAHTGTVREGLTAAFARYGIVPTLKTDMYGEEDTPTRSAEPADRRQIIPPTSSVQPSNCLGAR